MKKNFKFMILLLSLVLNLSAAALGQETTGNLEGTVKDASGAVVPNVTVTVASAQGISSGTTTTGITTGFKRTITTNEEGFFPPLAGSAGVI